MGSEGEGEGPCLSEPPAPGVGGRDGGGREALPRPFEESFHCPDMHEHSQHALGHQTQPTLKEQGVGMTKAPQSPES